MWAKKSCELIKKYCELVKKYCELVKKYCDLVKKYFYLRNFVSWEILSVKNISLLLLSLCDS